MLFEELTLDIMMPSGTHDKAKNILQDEEVTEDIGTRTFFIDRNHHHHHHSSKTYTEKNGDKEERRMRILLLSQLLRGPFLLLIATTWIITPYLWQIPTTVYVQVTLLGIGLMFCSLDWIFPFVESQTRYYLQIFLNSIVLDDILKAIYDPENGIIATMVGSCLGVSAMYSLGMNEEQRTKLVLSLSLPGITTTEEAHSILHQPGGCKTLLPQNLQTWLLKTEEEKDERNGDDDDKANKTTVVDEKTTERTILITTTTETTDNGHQSDNSTDCSSEGCKSVPTSEVDTIQLNADSVAFASGQYPRRSIDVDDKKQQEDDRQKSADSQSNQDQDQSSDVDPISVMISIMKDILYKKIKQQAITISQSISQSKFDNVATTASIALIVQQLWFFQRRRRRYTTTKLSSIVSGLVLSGTAITAITGLLAKEISTIVLEQQEQKRAASNKINNNVNSSQLVIKIAFERIFKRLIINAKNKFQLKRILAMFVLFWVGRGRGGGGDQKSQRRRTYHPMMETQV